MGGGGFISVVFSASPPSACLGGRLRVGRLGSGSADVKYWLILFKYLSQKRLLFNVSFLLYVHKRVDASTSVPVPVV